MKSYITNNWKKILITIGLICIAINVTFKIGASKTLLQDYAKYGKDIEKAEITETIGGAVNTQPISESPFGSGIVGVVGLLIVLILIVIILSTLAENAAKKAKKK